MHLDWLFEFVLAVERFSIAQAIRDSACAASVMITCLNESNIRMSLFVMNIYIYI